jgi:putative aldouronate transport system substrate-binding protein
VKKRSLLILTVIMLAVSILSACGSKASKSNSEPVTNGGENQEQEGRVAFNIVDGKLDPPLTFTTIRYESPAMTFREGENITDNVHTRWAKETLGVEIKTLWTGGLTDGSYDTKLKLMLASGDELPDVIIAANPSQLHMLIESGKFMEVEEVFEKYASPLFKAAMAEDPSAWDHVTIDGKKMAIGGATADIGHAQNVLWIRQDWLNKFSLQPPTNIDELEHIMDVFANQDPDGNGQNDTIALDIAMKDRLTGQTLGDSSWIFGMFGAIPERWYPGEDGKLKYGSVQPEIKDALLKLKEWKDKGYLASDVAIHDANTIVPAVAANKIGIIAAPNYFMAYPGSLLLASEPTALYTSHPIPQGPDGSVMRTSFNMIGGVLINKDISEGALQAYFHYTNSLYEGAEDPTLFKGFQEGYDYVIVDGEIVTNEDTVQTTDYVFGGIPSRLSTVLERFMTLINNEPIPQEDRLKYISYPDPSNPINRTMFDAMAVSLSQPEANVKQYYLGPVTPTMNSRQELLQKAQMETYAKIIYGEADAEAFDKYVEQYYSMGGSTIIEEVNQWYESLPKR